MPKLHGVKYEEATGQDNIVTFDDTLSGTATRHFDVAWISSRAFMFGLLGHPDPNNSINQQQAPDQHPQFPELYVRRVSRKPQGDTGTMGDDGHIQYVQCRITVQYERPAFTVDGRTPYMEESMDFSPEVITVPDGTYKYKSDGEPVNVTIAKITGTTERILTFHRIEAADPKVFRGLQGAINAQVFLGIEIGKALMVGASIRRQRGSGSGGLFTVTVRIREREEKWNYAYRPSSNAWEELEPHPYTAKSFTDLLPAIP